MHLLQHLPLLALLANLTTATPTPRDLTDLERAKYLQRLYAGHPAHELASLDEQMHAQLIEIEKKEKCVGPSSDCNMWNPINWFRPECHHGRQENPPLPAPNTEEPEDPNEVPGGYYPPPPPDSEPVYTTMPASIVRLGGIDYAALVSSLRSAANSPVKTVTAESPATVTEMAHVLRPKEPVQAMLTYVVPVTLPEYTMSPQMRHDRPRRKGEGEGESEVPASVLQDVTDLWGFPPYTYTVSLDDIPELDEEEEAELEAELKLESESNAGWLPGWVNPLNWLGGGSQELDIETRLMESVGPQEGGIPGEEELEEPEEEEEEEEEPFEDDSWEFGDDEMAEDKEEEEEEEEDRIIKASVRPGLVTVKDRFFYGRRKGEDGAEGEPFYIPASWLVETIDSA